MIWNLKPDSPSNDERQKLQDQSSFATFRKKKELKFLSHKMQVFSWSTAMVAQTNLCK